LPAPDDLALLVAAAEAAGAIAARHFGRGPEAWDKGGGLGPVTEADMEIDAMLRDMLLGARPDHGWLSEETEDGPERLDAERVFVVDPLDGTRAFIAGEPSFAHSLALVEAGRVVAGVVHLPKLGRTYAARAGGGAERNGAPIRVAARRRLEGATVIAPRNNLEPAHWPGGMPDVRRHFRPSLAYRLCLMAEGRFDAMLTLRPTWEWDVAAGSLIAAEAGAAVTTRSGDAPRFNKEKAQVGGLVAANPALHAQIIARLNPGEGPRRVDREGVGW
jgi:myo-inositol-1(or 4)-monophosphatase